MALAAACFTVGLPMSLAQPTPNYMAAAFFVLVMFIALFFGEREEIQVLARKLRRRINGFSVRVSDKLILGDDDSGGLQYLERRYWLEVYYRKPIPNLDVQIVSVDPPLPGLPLPLPLTVRDAAEVKDHDGGLYIHPVLVIEGKRFHSDGRKVVELQHSLPDVSREIPNVSYTFRIVVKTIGDISMLDKFDPIHAWIHHDAINF